MKDEKIAIIGTGMMGMSLAALFTGNGYDTTVLATKEASALRGRNSYNEMYSVLQERGLVSETQMARCAENLHFTLDYRDLAACTVFFESVVEDQKVKHDVYMHIQESCPVCKVIASTSSAMAPEDLCAGLDCANKIVVTHPFNPPHLVPFVEIRRFWVYREQLGAFAVFTNIFGNVIGFLPFGFILPVIFRRMNSGFLICISGFILSLTVEVIQLVTKVGCFDVDDMILNTLGAALGYVLFLICNHIRRKFHYGKKI